MKTLPSPSSLLLGRPPLLVHEFFRFGCYGRRSHHAYTDGFARDGFTRDFCARRRSAGKEGKELATQGPARGRTEDRAGQSHEWRDQEHRQSERGWGRAVPGRKRTE